ncbi:hypothetical protein [Streptomyces sp. CB01881]|uniref:hypothetical protein n=1 Tax=Streptomyces sp. CB01881 TaxID=2078691 RepID=UPI0018846D20|nr:hypothetical protein [Streptomyces sp. CB01881]
MPHQTDWRFCAKCHGMYFDGFSDKGTCPAGGPHAAAGFNFALPHDIPDTPTAQSAWRFCAKCHGMYFDGFPDKGTCPASGPHAAAGFNFVLPHDIPDTPTAQSAWRFCAKCHGMYFDGFPDKGACPASGPHAAAGFNFVLPHDVPSRLDFNFSPIVFAEGIPVGGNANLTIRDDGSLTFTGHFHDSGADEFNTQLVWGVKDAQNKVYAFQHTGHVAGTFEPGSRNDDWVIDSRSDQIADNWANIAANPTAHAEARVNADLINVTNSVIGALGTTLGVVALVIAA